MNLIFNLEENNICGPFLTVDEMLIKYYWFTSYNLVQYLQENDTTYVGTIRQNRRSVKQILKLYYYSILTFIYIFSGARRFAEYKRWGNQEQPIRFYR